MQPYFFVRHESRYIKLSVREILYVESVKNYVRVVTTGKSYLVLISLRQMEEELPQELFCRVHRGYLVSLPHIISFDSNTVQVDKKQIPISEQYRQVLFSRVKILISDTRQKNTLDKLDVDSLLN